MKLAVRILLSVLCAAMVLAIPFTVSAPNLLEDAKWEMIEVLDAGEAEGLLRLLFPVACAEEDVSYSLPVDNSPGMVPNPALFTEDGYEDETIRVRMETTEEDGVTWHIAWVEIASPTQLRTAIAGKKVTSKKDTLIIDRNGDFHLDRFIKGKNEASEYAKAHKDEIVNVFTFGPALVKDGQKMEIDEHYGYNPNGREPRSAIGQVDTLSYVMVVAEGRGDSAGVSFEELAQKMYDLGCKQAFNLDGGNSSIMIFNGKSYQGQPGGSERAQSDIIYFATAVPE